jgi:altronate hydrolase
MIRVLRIHPNDDVAVALSFLPKGDTVLVEGINLTPVEDIAVGHKIALHPIQTGQPIRKFGAPIGHATRDIPAGAHVHGHNCATNLSGELAYTFNGPALPRPESPIAKTWQGYLRPDGRAGTRNELWIIPTVGCVNRTAEALVKKFDTRRRPGIDAIAAWPHPHGCSQLGADHAATRTILADLVKHPNAGGVLVIGLGCENLDMKQFRDALGPVDTRRIRFLVTQDVPDELEAGLNLLEEIADAMAHDRRQPLPASSLVVGLKCGGSDGLSGITANPLLGRLCDRLTDAGGSAILTEVPEMFGAESRLMDRTGDRGVFEATVDLINGFKRYYQRYNQVVYENPSPGNKDGGITTLEEKSLGCTQKGGDAVVVDVLKYGERIRKPGLTLLEGPGNDIVACTALTAAGAGLILFTTGRGTPLGGPAPTLKVASNSDLAKRKPAWIDFDAGVLITGTPRQQVDEAFLELVLATASGQLARNETHGYREISIFKNGVTL